MYLDPGFGGMLVQIIVALAATGGALLFAFRRKISALFNKNKGTPAAVAPSADLTDDDVLDTISGTQDGPG